MGTDKTAYAKYSDKGAREEKKRAAPQFVPSQFVQYELNKEQAARCKAWDFSETDAFEALLKLCEEDYKITFRHDDKNRCSACWIVAADGHKINGGYILPGRGSTPFKALKQCCFKHWSLFDGAWGDYVGVKEAEEIDD